MNKGKSLVFQSGWFYLWLCIVSVMIFANLSNHFSKIESFNLNLVSKIISSDKSTPIVARIIDINSDEKGLDKVSQLAKKHPKSVFIFTDDYPKSFIKNLELGSAGSIFASTSNSSILPIQKVQNTNALFFEHIIKVDWKTSTDKQYALQSNPNNNFINLVWKSDNEIYPSAIGQALIKLNESKDLPLNISISNENELIINNEKYPFGISGKIVPLFRTNKIFKSELLLVEEKNYPFLVIDNLLSNQGEVFVNSLNSLVAKDYLIRNWFSFFLEYLLLFLCLTTTYFLRKKALIKQLMVFVSVIPFLLLFQFLMLQQGIWIPIHLILLVVGVGVFILAASKKERDNLFKLVGQKEDLLKLCEEVKNKAEQAGYDNLVEELGESIGIHQSETIKTLATEENDSELEKTFVIDRDTSEQRNVTPTLLKIEHFGRYKVEGILGKGAMGIVYQGVDPKINRYVAIKSLQLSDELETSQLAETKQRFFREAEMAGNLSHANIVTIYDVGEQIVAHSKVTLGYIAMDLLTGAPLSEYVKQDKLLPTPLVYQLMIQMTDALDYAHQKQVIHRDIKPSNIIYDDELQRGTLTDFGIAYMADHSKTRTGTIVGSPYYMSPEQVIGKKVDSRSDIFSLGVTFYQLLTGHLPFTGESIASVAYHITKTKQKSVSHWNNKLPSSATRICNKAMQKDVNKRYQSMEQFKQALINALKRDYKKQPIS